MKNIFINNYRKKVKRNTIIDNTDNQFFINSGSTVENDAETNMLMKELHGMIDKLEDNLRTPFLKHCEGFKYQEIADELELPLGTVKSRIFFARKAIKEMIHFQYGDVDMFQTRLAS
jgi:RNA polymerase sigma-70 factor (ECF subfamily)